MGSQIQVQPASPAARSADPTDGRYRTSNPNFLPASTLPTIILSSFNDSVILPTVAIVNRYEFDYSIVIVKLMRNSDRDYMQMLFSDFIKKIVNAYYKLKFVWNWKDVFVIVLTETEFDVDHVTGFIRELVPEACVIENIGTEISYRLPEQGAHSGQFERLFTELDDNLSTLNVSGYGVSDTSLEEVSRWRHLAPISNHWVQYQVPAVA